MIDIRKILTIVFIVLLVLFIIAIIIYVLNIEKVEKISGNKALNEVEAMALMKNAIASLPNFDNETQPISDENMLKFALSYMGVSDEYDITYDYDEENAIVKIADANEIVKYIFDRAIDYTKVSYIINDDTIEIPITIGSTDLEIYKIKSKEYDKNTGVTIVTIDCIEPDIDNAVELKDPNTLEYSEEDVVGKAIFKYKELDGRKVLLAFRLEEKY